MPLEEVQDPRSHYETFVAHRDKSILFEWTEDDMVTPIDSTGYSVVGALLRYDDADAEGNESQIDLDEVFAIDTEGKITGLVEHEDFTDVLPEGLHSDLVIDVDTGDPELTTIVMPVFYKKLPVVAP